MIDDEPLNAAMLEAAAPIVAAARIHGPWPRVTSDEFLSSALVVRQAVLITVGISRVHLGDPVRALLREVSDAVRGDDMEAWRGLAANRRSHGTAQEMAARREVLVTPVYCTWPGCRLVLSVPHPLPDLARVRCGAHPADGEAAA